MNLRNKKKLIGRVLKVGTDRIILDSSRKEEIKEAITRQDIKDLKKERVIKIRPISGRRKNVKRKTKRRGGSVKKKVKKRKQEYMIITRKLREHLKTSLKKNELTNEEYQNLRKRVKARDIKTVSQLREIVKEIVEK